MWSRLTKRMMVLDILAIRKIEGVGSNTSIFSFTSHRLRLVCTSFISKIKCMYLVGLLFTINLTILYRTSRLACIYSILHVLYYLLHFLSSCSIIF